MGLKKSLPVSGLLVAYSADPYEVTDRDTGEKNKGVTRLVYVSEAFDEPPAEVKFKSDADAVAAFEKIVAAGQFATVNLQARVAQYGGRDAFLQFLELAAVTPAK